jgi:HSP20 family protein
MSNLVRFDPFREMTTLRDTMERFFDRNIFHPGNGWSEFEGDIGTLALDLYETDDNLIVEAPLAGVDPNDVEIAISGNVLTIKGETEKMEEKKENGNKYYCRERRYGSFHRTVTLPTDVDADKVEAVFEKGVLKLTLPIVETVKPKRIEIKAKG